MIKINKKGDMGLCYYSEQIPPWEPLSPYFMAEKNSHLSLTFFSWFDFTVERVIHERISELPEIAFREMGFV